MDSDAYRARREFLLGVLEEYEDHGEWNKANDVKEMLDDLDMEYHTGDDE